MNLNFNKSNNQTSLGSTITTYTKKANDKLNKLSDFLKKEYEGVPKWALAGALGGMTIDHIDQEYFHPHDTQLHWASNNDTVQSAINGALLGTSAKAWLNTNKNYGKTENIDKIVNPAEVKKLNTKNNQIFDEEKAKENLIDATKYAISGATLGILGGTLTGLAQGFHDNYTPTENAEVLSKLGGIGGAALGAGYASIHNFLHNRAILSSQQQTQRKPVPAPSTIKINESTILKLNKIFKIIEEGALGNAYQQSIQNTNNPQQTTPDNGLPPEEKKKIFRDIRNKMLLAGLAVGTPSAIGGELYGILKDPENFLSDMGKWGAIGAGSAATIFGTGASISAWNTIDRKERQMRREAALKNLSNPYAELH